MNNKTLVAALALTLLASTALISVPARAEDKPDFATEKLTGNWGGARDTLYSNGLSFDIHYDANFWYNMSGGTRTSGRAFDNLDLQTTVDGEKAYGLKGSKVFLYLLNNNGTRINDVVGSLGGIDNEEVSEGTFKLYEAWVEQNILDDRVSLRAGLYDLNSEFYVTDASGLFLNPTYGIGTEMAFTGQNGPSVFPTTSLAARLTVVPMENTYIQAAILDGVPGDPNNPHGTQVEFKNKEGALDIVEAGYKHEAYGHYGVGAWQYTAKQADLISSEPTSSKGMYFLGEGTVYNANGQKIDVFARYGFTDGDTTQIKAAWSAGAVFGGFISARPDGQFGFAASGASNADKYKTSVGGLEDSETQFELTYADSLRPGVTIQPDLQYTINPGTDPTLDNAWTAGVRIGLDF